MCSHSYKYKDSVKRLVRSAYGQKHYILVKRYKCSICGEIHRCIPDEILPYKHYEKVIIFGFVKGELSLSDSKYEDYPAEITVKRWSRELL